MSDKDFLTWPFFEEDHRVLARELEAWAAATLGGAVHDHRDVDAECRRLVRHHERAGQTQTQFAIFNLDFREAGIVENLRQLAHQFRINTARRNFARLRRTFLRHAGRGRLHNSSGPFLTHSLLPSFASKAAASMASKYDVAPNPAITPFAAWPTNET